MNNTPVEIHYLGDTPIQVKREDLCAGAGAPTFSKMRGVMEALRTMKAEGVRHVGYVETSVSMAGWGVCWACQQLGLRSTIFCPTYTTPQPLLEYHRKQWVDATVVPIPAGMAKVNWYVSRGLLQAADPRAVLLPLGLPFPDTVAATCAEALKTVWPLGFPDLLVVAVGSGTICAGLLRAFQNTGMTLQGVMTRTGSPEQKREAVEIKAGVYGGGLLACRTRLELVDEGWEYAEACERPVPFPCHPWYDAKAWEWLRANIKIIPFRWSIGFWNIGALPGDFEMPTGGPKKGKPV